MGFDAFKQSEEGPELKLDVTKFTDTIPTDSAKSKILEVQDSLDKMQAMVNEDLEGDEVQAVWAIIEAKLEASIPDNFKEIYENSSNPEAAAKNIAYNILLPVNNFITRELEDIIEEVDDETWTGSMSRKEFSDIVKQVGSDLKEEDVTNLLVNYSPKGEYNEDNTATENTVKIAETVEEGIKIAAKNNDSRGLLNDPQLK